jgi:1-acyl-sn-glycerol-3-phosphate acyltransferase
MGWKVINDFPDLKKYVIIAAPHTSWQDFPIALMTKYIKSLKVNFIGKASLFKPPFGFIFRWLGGAPIDRSKSNDKVKAIVDLFNAHEQFVLGMSPEGTRQKVDQWKTGFYYIAKGAKVPIVMATLDFQHKQIKISDPYYLTDDLGFDFKQFHQYFDGVVGKHPELS